MKKSILIVICLALAGMAMGQRKLTGLVTDKASGQPLIGVNVFIKGTTKGALTDVDGKYSLDVKGEHIVVQFRYMGYVNKEVEVGNQKVLNVGMEVDAKELDEIVVTALGIKREEKALGYSLQKISESQLTDAPSGNWLNALTGKVAGMNVTSAGSGPAGSSRITLRGEASLNMSNNNALVIIDGVPVDNSMTTDGGSSGGGVVDYGTSLSDLNPDDIEEMSILKGASATALYGSRAANGAIVITTKSGKRDDGRVGVSVNISSNIEQAYNWPDYQYTYGAGAGSINYFAMGNNIDGVSNTSGTNVSFGPRFQGQSFFQYNSPKSSTGMRVEKTPWVAYPNNHEDFAQLGNNFTSSIAVEGGNSKTKVRASLNQSKTNWIMENTATDRYGAQLSINHSITNKLKLEAKANYSYRSSPNLPATGIGASTIANFYTLLQPNANIDWYKPRWIISDGTSTQNRPFSSLLDNPYVSLYDITNSSNRNSLTGTFSLSYEISPKLNLMVRTGLNYSNDDRIQKKPFDTQNYRKGYYREQNLMKRELNSDFLLKYEDKFLGKLDLTASLGGNMMYQNGSTLARTANRLLVPDVYNLQNSQYQVLVDAYHYERATNSIYAMAQFCWDKYLFVDLTGRNDVSSTLPVKNNSFFYPSISTSFVLTDLLKKHYDLPRNITMIKLRASLAQVGNDAGLYQTNNDIYVASAFAGTFTKPTILYNENLEPEITTSTELGIDARFFDSRVNLDLAYYFNRSKNQIVSMPVEPATGFQSAMVNAGEITNQGIEAQLTLVPIKIKRGLTWKITANWSMNENILVKLASGVDTYVLSSPNSALSIEARPGERIGGIYGLGNLRYSKSILWPGYEDTYNPEWEGMLINDSSGLPVPSTEFMYLGNSFPWWKAGIINEFTYKGFKLSFQFDGQYGGKVFSKTIQTLTTYGRLQNTVYGRDELAYMEFGKPIMITAPVYDAEGLYNTYGTGTGIVSVGLRTVVDGIQYMLNDIVVQPDKYWSSYAQSSNIENSTFDATYIKLREARLEYAFPEKILKRTPFDKASVGIWGRNLLIWTSFPGYDPEVAVIDGSTMVPGVEQGSFPSTRTLGFNLKFSF